MSVRFTMGNDKPGSQNLHLIVVHEGQQVGYAVFGEPSGWRRRKVYSHSMLLNCPCAGHQFK